MSNLKVDENDDTSSDYSKRKTRKYTFSLNQKRTKPYKTLKNFRENKTTECVSHKKHVHTQRSE